MINWQEVQHRATQLLSDYLAIPSINPPGDVLSAANFLAKHLEESGLTPQYFHSQPKRVNLLARLPGNGQKKPVLLYNHMDVVEVDRTRWTCDPFGGEVKEGYIYGRGAIDMKGMGIMQLVALDLLRRFHPERSRDIIFYAAPDEETGGEFGAKWMIDNHWEALQPEFVWDEGGFGFRELFGASPVFMVALAEKKTLWLKLIAHGQPGQSGMPHDDNAINILMHALNRLLTSEMGWKIIPLTKSMFKTIATVMPFPNSFLLKNLDIPWIFRLVRPRLISQKSIAAMLRDTISITSFKAGEKENVIPDTAVATIDVRLLPETDPQQFLVELSRLFADDRIEIEIILAPQEGSVSDINSEFYAALTRAIEKRVSGSLTCPMLTPGTTDSCFFRQKGVNSYGLFPAIIDPSELGRFHGIDERISVENLLLGIQIIYDVLVELTA